jgi:hypothetical protein
MDTQGLYAIISLQHENTVLKRGIQDAVFMLIGGRYYDLPESGSEDLRYLFEELSKILPHIEKQKEQAGNYP